MKLTRVGAALLVLAILAASAGAVEIHGNLITDFRDGERQMDATGWQATTQNGQFRLTTVSLIATHDFNDYMRGLFRTSNFRGGAMSVPEAWLAFDGLPWNGTFSMGRFFTPGGEPLPVIGVSIPTAVYRSQAVNGLKFHFEPTTNWRTEFGLTNLNALNLKGAVVGDAYVISRPTQNTIGSNLKQYYGQLGYQNGGAWGSLDLSAAYYGGRISQADINTLNGTSIPSNNIPGNIDRKHRVVDLSADYLYGRYRIYGQWIRGFEGDFRQTTWETAGSIQTGSLTWTLSYGRLHNNAVKRGVNDSTGNNPVTTAGNSGNGVTWNRERLIYSLGWAMNPAITMTLEYEHNREFVGIMNNNNPVPNNVFGVQLNASF